MKVNMGQRSRANSLRDSSQLAYDSFKKRMHAIDLYLDIYRHTMPLSTPCVVQIEWNSPLPINRKQYVIYDKIYSEQHVNAHGVL